MPKIPSLNDAFARLQSAFKVPAASTFQQPAAAGMSRPAIPNMSTVGSGTFGAPMSVVPKSPLASIPKPATPVVSPTSFAPSAPMSPLNATQPGGNAPNMSTLQGPRYAPPPTINPNPPLPNMSTPNGPAYAPPPNLSGPMSVGSPAAPAAPAIPSAPSLEQTDPGTGYVKTPSGAVVDPKTGALISGGSSVGAAPEGVTVGSNTGNQAGSANYAGSAGGSPAVPSVGSSADQAFAAYLESLKPSKEEDEYQKRLDEINLSADKAYVDTQNQPIALPFITGQQAALQRSQALLTRPLESSLARMEAKRTAAMGASKSVFERLDTKEKDLRDNARETGKPVALAQGSSLVDPRTGKTIAGGAFSTPAASTGNWASLIKNGQAQLSDVPSDMRTAVASELSTSPQVSKKSKDAISQATVVMDYIDKADGQINGFTTGVVGVGSALIPGTPAYNLAKTIDTIRANVGFQALQAMRDASPTGGALGQVSEQENRLLQATLGSLDIGQGEEQLRANMAKVKQHFSNLVAILSAPPTAQVSYDQGGNVVVSGGSGGSQGGTGDVAGEGWF